ncbi:hypothetical protein R1flu_011106 [Riccia fluitans]|uniref:Uncharacterized protein n=1 Tax=Riccia fluitans TaxID=41844 RepID=A0ABD1Z9D3_9MARC
MYCHLSLPSIFKEEAVRVPLRQLHLEALSFSCGREGESFNRHKCIDESISQSEVLELDTFIALSFSLWN